MKQLLLGGALGALLTGVSVWALFEPTQNSANGPGIQHALTPQVKYGATWSGLGTNHKLAKGRPEFADDLNPGIADDFPFMSLSINQPVEPITRSDIERVCLSPSKGGEQSPSFYSVEITLTPDARKRIGNTLEAYDNQDASIRLWQYEINSFSVDAAKAKLFSEGKSEDQWLADIGFIVDEQAILEGFTLVKVLTGQDTLEGCHSSDNVENIPGYQYHMKFWEAYKKKIAAEN